MAQRTIRWPFRKYICAGRADPRSFDSRCGPFGLASHSEWRAARAPSFSIRLRGERFSLHGKEKAPGRSQGLSLVENFNANEKGRQWLPACPAHSKGR